MLYGSGMTLPPVFTDLFEKVNDATSEGNFEVARTIAISAIDVALDGDCQLDSTQILSLRYAETMLKMGKYMQPPVDSTGASVDNVLASLLSLKDMLVFTVAEFYKLISDAALDYMKNANQDRMYAMAQERISMQAGYEQNVAAADAAQQAALVQAITTMAEGIVSGVVSCVSTGFALKSAKFAKEDADATKTLKEAEGGLARSKKTYEEAEEAVQKAATGTPSEQLTAADVLKNAKTAMENYEKGVETARQDAGSKQALSTAYGAVSNAISSMSKVAQISSAAGNLNASYDTQQSKLDEAVANFMKSLETIANSLKQTGDEGCRAALELINSVTELLKESINLCYKGPSGF